MDERYDYALAAALVILDQLDLRPDMPKHERVDMATFAVLHGMERYEEEREKHVPQPSAN